MVQNRFLFARRSELMNLVYPEKFYDIDNAHYYIVEDLMFKIKQDLLEQENKHYLNETITIELVWQDEPLEGKFIQANVYSSNKSIT